MTITLKCTSKNAITNVGGTTVTAQFQSASGSFATVSNIDPADAEAFTIGGAFILSVTAAQA